MQSQKSSLPGRTSVRLAFTPDRLESLIQQGKLHAADFNCLDKQSKSSVWSMLLSAAANRIKQS